MTLTEFESLPIIMSFFPLKFPTGNQQWTTFAVCCNNCKKKVPEELTRGNIEKEIIGDYRRNVIDYYHVVAHALCPTCNKLTTAIYKLHEDMTISEFHQKSGTESRWSMRKLTFWDKIRDKFKKVR